MFGCEMVIHPNQCGAWSIAGGSADLTGSKKFDALPVPTLLAIHLSRVRWGLGMSHDVAAVLRIRGCSRGDQATVRNGSSGRATC
jgi:hypothetical protein